MSLNKLFIEDLQLKSTPVIVRVDFNVPINNGKVDNDKRLRASLPTIQHLIKQGARTVLMSHLGRPKGKVVDSLRMGPVAERLSELLGQKVYYVTDCIGDEVSAAVQNLKDGEVLLLENLRFYPEEEKNDADFAKKLASGIKVYVNDAFGTAHRAHASTEGIAAHVEQAACGYLMKKELEFLGAAIANPTRPYVAITGGAKISGKIDMIQNLLPKVDALLIGGGMTYTFLKAQGLEIGKSLLEAEKVDLAASLLKQGGDKLVLPVDFRVSPEMDFDNRTVGALTTVGADAIPADQMGLDIGPETIQKFCNIILNAKTIVWNGPMGVFEIAATAEGTHAVARALAEATAKGATTIIGGGDSASAVEKAGLADKVSHVSTGGGASLEFLEGRALPGVLALTDK
ncbi:MAG: phosphoglycerate kinase [Leptospiraceae bacterium]|nr:phosphoglycerate kinase [Leptospiraceae bacterium]